MGGAVSSGRDNNELVDNLMSGGYIRTRTVERVFRSLDRADYMTPLERDQAYKDLAWRSGALHLSAPCIYSEVLEALELRPGLSFLNIGSGTGYLSTMVGLIIGSGGINHGVEIHPGVVEYSTKKQSQFQENCVSLDEFDFCIPKYYCGNALCLAPLQTLYDRVYVGAGVLAKYENYFKQLIKVDGVLVMPLGDTLVQILRTSETVWTTRQLLNVSFALLRSPTKEEVAEPLKLDELVPVSLMVLCRASIRRAMLAGVCRRHPELKEPAPRRPPAARPRPRRICIPLDPNTDDPSMNELHDMEGHEGGREMNALLSLVLSMGNNRVAGSLRFDDSDDHAPQHDEFRMMINEIDERSRSSSEGSGTEGPAPADSAPRPSGEGAAGAGRHTARPARGSTVPGAHSAGTHVRAPGEAVPNPMPGTTDLSALTPAGVVECDVEGSVEATPDLPDNTAGEESSSGTDDSKPSTSGKSPGAERATKDAPDPAEAGPSGTGPNGYAEGTASRNSSGTTGSAGGSGTKRSGDAGESDAPRRRRTRGASAHSRRHRGNTARSKRFPAEQVQIYFGNAGVYDRSDVIEGESEDEPANASATEDVVMQDSTSSEDEEPPRTSKDTKRQKLDSGIGEGTASGSSSVTPHSRSHSDSHSPDESDAGRSSSYTDASTTDNQDNSVLRVPRRRLRSRRRGGYDSDSDTSAACAARRARRSTRDARRVRLSIVMKRAVKELPLPYALKKFVNYQRCFEF